MAEFDSSDIARLASASVAAEMDPAILDKPAESRKRKSSDDPDTELRRHTDANCDRPLEELAQVVRAEDVNPQSTASERSRQIFGTVWLMKTCQVAPFVAIPRNRIYARYVEICAYHKIKPLNPAAFGKLVKLIFPDIKTRRLGVRGKSKYHYCGINIIGEANVRTSPGMLEGDDMNDMNAPVMMDEEDTFEPPRELRYDMTFDKTMPVFTDDFISPDAFSVPTLHFSKDVLTPAPIAFNNVVLPPIDPYIPAGTDRDAVDILTALCQSHCSSLLEAIRFMHLKQFLNTLSSFHGTLTAPVQKLLTIPSILEWVQRCDLIMYKEMVLMLSPLALQAVPTNVMSALRSLSMTLPQTMTSAFSTLPQPFVQVKLRPAYAFSNLIGRLLRVNDIANAAAKILANPNERRQMLADWMSFVDSKSIILREAPCGGALLFRVMTSDVVTLLTVPEDQKEASGVNDSPSYKLRAMPSSPLPESEPDPTGEGVIEQWAQYLMQLPLQFPDVSARVFLLYMNAVLTAALREITLNGGEAFGAWWMVRCWIDEWMSWLAEHGGFLSLEVPQTGAAPAQDEIMNTSVLNLDS